MSTKRVVRASRAVPRRLKAKSTTLTGNKVICPSCGSLQSVSIRVQTWADMSQQADGTELIEGIYTELQPEAKYHVCTRCQMLIALALEYSMYAHVVVRSPTKTDAWRTHEADGRARE